jgi:hypothetical protein
MGEDTRHPPRRHQRLKELGARDRDHRSCLRGHHWCSKRSDWPRLPRRSQAQPRRRLRVQCLCWSQVQRLSPSHLRLLRRRSCSDSRGRGSPVERSRPRSSDLHRPPTPCGQIRRATPYPFLSEPSSQGRHSANRPARVPGRSPEQPRRMDPPVPNHPESLPRLPDRPAVRPIRPRQEGNRSPGRGRHAPSRSRSAPVPAALPEWGRARARDTVFQRRLIPRARGALPARRSGVPRSVVPTGSPRTGWRSARWRTIPPRRLGAQRQRHRELKPQAPPTFRFVTTDRHSHCPMRLQAWCQHHEDQARSPLPRCVSLPIPGREAQPSSGLQVRERPRNQPAPKDRRPQNRRGPGWPSPGDPWPERRGVGRREPPQHQWSRSAGWCLQPARQRPLTGQRRTALRSRERSARDHRLPRVSRRRSVELKASWAARRLGREAAAPAVLIVTWRCWAPGRGSCPYATGRRPVGRLPRLGRGEIRLGPAWVRYRETATPETDPPSAFHRPVLIPGRHRARSSRLRVTLPRCRPSPRCPSAAMPTAPIPPARVRLLLHDPWSDVAGAVLVRPAACSGIRPCALLGLAVPHRVAD